MQGGDRQKVEDSNSSAYKGFSLGVYLYNQIAVELILCISVTCINCLMCTRGRKPPNSSKKAKNADWSLTWISGSLEQVARLLIWKQYWSQMCFNVRTNVSEAKIKQDYSRSYWTREMSTNELCSDNKVGPSNARLASKLKLEFHIPQAMSSWIEHLLSKRKGWVRTRPFRASHKSTSGK